MIPTAPGRRKWNGPACRVTGLAITALLLGAAGPPTDPDWPCVQRLVPTVTASTLWGGHDAPDDWRADPRLATLVPQLAQRTLPAADAAKTLDAFTATVPEAERPALLPRLFQGLVDETNTQRTDVIDRLHGITRHQRQLTETVSHVTAELRALPKDAPVMERDAVVSRRALMIREYEEIERTIRYACEAPVQMESKLGVLAQSLDRALAHP